MNSKDFLKTQVSVYEKGNDSSTILRDAMILKKEIIGFFRSIEEDKSHLFIRGMNDTVKINMSYEDLCIELFSNN